MLIALWSIVELSRIFKRKKNLNKTDRLDFVSVFIKTLRVVVDMSYNYRSTYLFIYIRRDIFHDSKLTDMALRRTFKEKTLYAHAFHVGRKVEWKVSDFSAEK
jgi:hypothetical protein